MTWPDEKVMQLLIHLGAGNKAEPGDDGVSLIVHVEAKSGIKPTRYPLDALDALEDRGWIEIEENDHASARLTERGRYWAERWWFKLYGVRVDVRHLRPAGRPIERLTADQLW